MLKNTLIHVTLSQNHMATTFHFTLSVKESEKRRAESCLLECHRLVETIENELTEFRSTSPVFKLNNTLPSVPVALSPRTLDLLETSTYLESLTQQAFSVAAKGGGTIEKDLLFSKGEQTASRLHPKAHLSFGAIGKGFALDHCRILLSEWGFEHFLLTCGSSILVSGFANDDIPWNIGWSPDGTSPSVRLSHKSGRPIAFGISGTSEQGYHIVDPRTQAKAQSAKSALVGHPSATYADALSTALFVLGWENGRTAFQQLLEKPSLAVLDATEDFHWNGTFQKEWGAIQ